MEWVETTGRTVDAALDAALDELGVDEEDVEFEVLADAKSGFLGLGGSDARIRARVKPLSREKPGERQRRRGRKEPRGRGNGASKPKEQSDSARPGKPRPDSGGRATRGVDAAATGEAARSSVSDAAPSVGEGNEQDGARDGTAGAPRRRRRGGRGRGGSGANRAAAPGDVGGDRTGPEGVGHEVQAAGASSPRGTDRNRNQQESRAVSSEEDVPIEEQAAAAEEFTQGLVDAFALGGQVATVIEDDVVTVEVSGGNLGLLVGPKGSTLHAIEELVRTVVQRQTDGHGVRIHVDVAGYRAKRRAALEDFTRKLVDKVLETGKAQALEPMSAADRKVVHDTAATVEGVGTESEGEDPRRRVIIRRA